MEWLHHLIDYGVIGLLGLMSLVALAVSIERLLVFKRIELKDFPSLRELELTLTHKMHWISTIGANAPYLGLLGTVLGIMLTFYSMGQGGAVDSGKIMVGLALAMKVTAAGLVVAIPSTAAYNLLLRRIRVLTIQWELLHG